MELKYIVLKGAIRDNEKESGKEVEILHNAALMDDAIPVHT